LKTKGKCLNGQLEISFGLKIGYSDQTKKAKQQQYVTASIFRHPDDGLD
jgi:hypothetical protein